ncbi:MAG: hypothetical protein RR691_08085, partial [Eubacterium sp.]
MRILFAHDHKFRKVDGKMYSIGGLSNDVLSRYVTLFGEVDVVSRCINEKEVENNYSLIQNPKIVFVEIKDKYTDIKDAVKKSDGVIARLPSFYGIISVKYAKLLNKPYMVEVVGCAWDSLWNHSIRGKLIALPARLVTKKIVSMAPYALYVTKYFLQKRYPCKGITVGISDVMLSNGQDNILKKRFSKIQDNIKKEIIIGTIGAVNVKYKGQQHVIKAINLLKNMGIVNIKYQIV